MRRPTRCESRAEYADEYECRRRQPDDRQTRTEVRDGICREASNHKSEKQWETGKRDEHL